MVFLNKRAQTNIFFILMMGIVFFVLGMALTPVIYGASNEATNKPELNCSLTNLTTVQQSTCTQIDMFAPLFMGTIFGLAAMLITAIGTS